MGINRSILAESIHTGFRKGTDCPEAHPIWKLINEMEPGDWDGYIEWVGSCIDQTNAEGVSDDLALALEGLRTEIGANRTLVATDDYNKGFNAGMTEAIRFIRKYEKGEGLWQIAAKKSQ